MANSLCVASADPLPALCEAALECHRAGRLTEAVAHYERILGLKPDFAQVHNNRGLALAELDRLEEAAAAYRRALDLRPGDPQTLCNLGVVLARLDRSDQAEASFRRAIAADPGFAGAWNNLGLTLKEQGRLLEAARVLEHAIRLSPREPSYYDNLAAVRPFTARDLYLTALEGMAGADGSMPPAKRMHLHFALAKAHEQIGRRDSAFRHLLAANALKRSQVAYDEAATLDQINRTRALFSRDFIRDRRGAGATSPLPVFIVGMPRSGTTLIEQILASHPQVFGGGELGLFEQSFNAVGSRLPQAPAFPEIAPAMLADDFRALGTAYHQKLRERAPEAARITDKMPGNFLFAGLIHLALPNATIIHAVRDPVDTCVSCFAEHFTHGQVQTYDLSELGRYYRHYQELMAHWHEVLPPGSIMDVHYEDLVADLEGTARRIVSHCGLAFDPRCLEFHRNDRTVRTASATQVRKPIYRTSVGRGRRFEKFLGPLLAGLTPEETAITPAATSALRRAGGRNAASQF